MLSFSEYVSALLGDLWRGQAPINRRGMSAIFGSAVAVQDDRPDEPDVVVAFVSGADDALDPLAEGLAVVIAALTGRVDGIRAIPCVSLPNVIAAEFSDLGGSPLAFEEAGIAYDTIITVKGGSSSGGAGITLVDSDADVEIASITVGDAVAFESVSDAVERIAQHVSDGSRVSNALTLEGVSGAVSAELLARVGKLVRANQDSVAQASGIQVGELDGLPETLSSAEAVVLVAALLTVADWFEIVDLQNLSEVVTDIPNWRSAASWTAASLTERGGVRLAIETLEAAVAGDAAAPVSTWLALARVYGAARRPDLAVATLQSALDVHQHDAALLRVYGQQLIQSQDLDTVDRSVFGEGSASAEDEALQALEESLRASPDAEGRLASLFLLVQGALGISSNVVWEYFSLLSKEDVSGRLVEGALALLLVRDDFERAVEPTERAAISGSSVGKAWRNYAFAAYHAGRPREGRTAAERAVELATTAAERGEAQLIAAYCETKGAEQLFSELADRIAVGREASERDLEFLEWLVESAPDHVEGYVVLARAYSNQDEPSTALEVLLEAHQRVGDIPVLLNELTDLLIEDDDLSVALDYVERALAADPQHVPSLVRAARVTYLLDDTEGARVFLRQAHTLSPYNEELVQLTREIAADDVD